MYNVGRLGFFVRAQPTFCYGRNWHVPIYSARKTLAHLGKKILFTEMDRKKWRSTSAWKDDRSRSNKEASPDDADRTFPNRRHANFVQGLNWKLKMYNVGRLGFFVRAQPTFCYGRNWHVPIYSARKTLAHLGKKILFTEMDRKKWRSTSAWKDDRSRSNKEASPDDADRTFPNRRHANFVQGLNWKLVRRHLSWSSDRYFSADIAQFFLEKLAGR